jgi:hypothetical protein
MTGATNVAAVVGCTAAGIAAAFSLVRTFPLMLRAQLRMDWHRPDLQGRPRSDFGFDDAEKESTGDVAEPIAPDPSRMHNATGLE